MIEQRDGKKTHTPGASRRILALSSAGGHWIQMLRILPALSHHEIHYASVEESYRSEVEGARFHIVPDANRDTKIAMLRQISSVLGVVRMVRPDVVISTGAAIGFWGVLFGRLFGAETIWIDSLANTERMSLSGRLARPLATLCLTQWPRVSRPGGPHYWGSVL